MLKYRELHVSALARSRFYRSSDDMRFWCASGRVIEISGSLIWQKENLVELIFNPCGEFR